MVVNINNNKTTSDDKYVLEVIGNNVLVKKIMEQKFGSLLLINNNEQYFRGIICGLGTGLQDKNGVTIPFYVKIGDEVFLPKYKGYDLRFGEESYVIIPENEIIAVIKEKKQI